MAKFKLEVAPTFKSTVALPIHGGKTVEVEFEFKHRTRAVMNEWMKGIAKRSDVEVLEDILAGWNLDDAFSREAIELLCQQFIGWPRDILAAYLDELTQARRKN